MLNPAFLYLFIPVLFWGVSYISIKVVLTQLDPVEMITARLFLATITLFLIIKLKGIRILPSVNWVKLIVASIIVFFHFWVMATGMQETSASNTAWILTTAPIFVAILAWLYLREPFGGWQWVGLIVASAGVVALSYNGDIANLGWTNSRGDFIVLGSCVTWGLYTVSARDITKTIDPLVATFWTCALAAGVFVPYTLATGGMEKYLALHDKTVVHLVFLGVGCLAISFWLWSEGLAKMNAAEVGLYLYVEPIITVVAAWVLLHEMPTWWLAIGAILISLGVYLAESFGKKIIPVEHDA
ncbi:MAG: DMT family transporter [Candidatus Zixiibacteriota bacterium]